VNGVKSARNGGKGFAVNVIVVADFSKGRITAAGAQHSPQFPPTQQQLSLSASETAVITG